MSTFEKTAPRDPNLVGLKGRAGEWIDRVAPICAPWLPKSQTFGKPFLGQFHGDSRGGREREQSCGSLGVINGAIQSWHIQRLSSDNFIKYLTVWCTRLAPPGDTKFYFGGPITGDQGRNLFDRFGKVGPDDLLMGCLPSELATGIHGSAGLFVDAIGLICGPRPFTLMPPATSVNPLAVAPTTATKVNPLAVAPVREDMFTILKPTNGVQVAPGQVVLLVKPPKLGTPPVTAIEFQWLDAPSGQPSSYTVAVETPKLLQDYLVPQQSQPRNAGRCEVRARTAAQPTPGPWSQPAQFRVVIVQPFQSQRQPSPIQQTAPLPSSSVTQPSPIPQTAPLPSSAVTQTPAPSSSAPAADKPIPVHGHAARGGGKQHS